MLRHAGFTRGSWRSAVNGSTLLSGASASSVSAGAVVCSTRSFFPPGTAGKDLLRALTTPAEPAKAFSPLDKLRPPAPPAASDARPFGSLNRNNQLGRYVNVNSTAGDAAQPTAASGVPSTPAAASATSVKAAPAPMDLSRLVRRHQSTAANTLGKNASSASASSAPPAAAAATAAESAASSSASSSSSSTMSTVAKAEAAIAAAQKRMREQKRKADAAAAAFSSSSPSAAASSSSSGSHASQQAGDSRGHGSTSGAAAFRSGGSDGSAGGHAETPARQHSQVYKEHCNIGWSPEEFYRVVADVEHYTDFLPWCAGSEVHSTRRVRVPRGRRLLAGNMPSVETSMNSSGGGRETAAAAAAAAAAKLRAAQGGSGSGAAFPALSQDAIAAAEAELVDAIEMTATLTIGFSFLKEQYTSRVTLYPGTKIVAALYDEESAEAGMAGTNLHHERDSHDSFVVSLFKKAASTAGAVAKRSILKHLLCEWEFCPVPGKPNTVEVVFSVSFEFKNPLHGHMIMSNVVTLMTRSFERRCESLYGPPSASKESLPLFF